VKQALPAPPILTGSSGVIASCEGLPLAKAIVDGAIQRGATFKDIDVFEPHTNKGGSAVMEDGSVLVGNVKLMDENGVETKELIDQTEALRSEEQTVMFASIDGKVAGLLSSPIRSRRQHTRRSKRHDPNE
jgi:cation transport ATPase